MGTITGSGGMPQSKKGVSMPKEPKNLEGIVGEFRKKFPIRQMKLKDDEDRGRLIIVGGDIESFLRSAVREILKAVELKERSYSREARVFNMDSATLQGAFHEHFIEGYNQAVEDFNKKKEKFLCPKKKK